MTDEELWLYTLCRKNNISITDIQISRLSAFKTLLLEWNARINLISRKNEENIWKGHIALSISMLFKIRFRPGMHILDLGTGGGFPGIPLAIMHPDCTFLLLDSTQKKVNAVKNMAETIGLPNVATVWGRAEELQQQPQYAGKFDAVVARSVSRLSNLLEWGMPFLKKGAGANTADDFISITAPSLITFKGMEIEQEEAEARTSFPNVSLHSVPLVFPGSEIFDSLEKKLTIATITQRPR